MSTSPSIWQSRATKVGLALAVTAAVGGVIAWSRLQPQGLPEGIASGNGRLEATDIDIATRSGGRVKEVLVQEGAWVQAGQVVATMDTESLQADVHRAQAQVTQARHASETAAAMLKQREQSVLTAQSQVSQRLAEQAFTAKEAQRTRELVGQGFLAPQKLDQVQVQTQSAKAALEAAQSQVAEARASVTAAQAQVVEAQSAIETALAVQARIQTDLNDAQLKAPRPGRVQLLSARAGEVLSPGGRVMSLIDLSDVSMSFFLPEIAAGRLAIGSEARLVMDAAPQYVIPARVTFVASNAQFTPKTVETQSERQKMVFKVKARIDADLLKRYRSQVKTGMPGMAYVRVDSKLAWPDALSIALPTEPTASATP